jgi:O-succinylbenzoate synthase
MKTPENKKKLLEIIRPKYIVLKPSLLGGFRECEEWIKIAGMNNIKWWVTSALESNVGLNAIAQWTYTLKNELYQGLGTGQLYKNNFLSPLGIGKGKLFYLPGVKWDLSYIL